MRVKNISHGWENRDQTQNLLIYHGCCDILNQIEIDKNRIINNSLGNFETPRGVFKYYKGLEIAKHSGIIQRCWNSIFFGGGSGGLVGITLVGKGSYDQ